MTFAAEGDAAESVMAAFTAAEIAIKKNERFTLALPVAAVNQLRYAAKHLACAMQSGTGVKDRSEQLNKAVCHCDRARFDALDGIIYSALDFIAAFQRLCRTRRNVAAVYPDLRQDYDEIAGLQERLQALPKVQDMTSDALAEMEALAEKFISFKRRILRFIPIVEKRERIFADENACSAARQFLASFMVSAAGAAVGLLGTLCAIWTMIQESFAVGVATAAITVLAIILVTKRLYRYAVKRMLTAEQREALLGVEDFSFAKP